jgi:phosphopantetheinyl transferase
VLAVSDGPVGVDIELLPGADAVQPVGMTPSEQARLAALPADRRPVGALRLWTAKEAVLKAGSRSLADDPITVEVADLLAADSVTTGHGNRIWTVRLLHDDPPVGDRAVVAVADADGAPITWRARV